MDDGSGKSATSATSLIVNDLCWQHNRQQNGNMLLDSVRFRHSDLRFNPYELPLNAADRAVFFRLVLDVQNTLY
jgi:hypothetical protein